MPSLADYAPRGLSIHAAPQSQAPVLCPHPSDSEHLFAHHWESLLPMLIPTMWGQMDGSLQGVGGRQWGAGGTVSNMKAS